MTDAGPLATAAAELYACDLDEFTGRRAELAARARTAGDRAAAAGITGLRKPTRSAWLINQLVRADPEVPGRLAGLGGELRAAAESMNGPRIRELSQRRRRLVDDLVRRALGRSGQQVPAAVREELTATFGAALADPEVAEQLAAGTLVRAVHQGGAGVPEAQRVPAAASGEPARGRIQREERAPGRAERGAARRAERAAAGRAAAERAAAQRAAAEQAAADADRAAGSAAEAEEQLRDRVQRLEGQLEELRAQLAGARRDLGAARARSRAARRAQQAARAAAGRPGG